MTSRNKNTPLVSQSNRVLTSEYKGKPLMSIAKRDEIVNMAKEIGTGEHGKIYTGVKGSDAEQLLIMKKGGEVQGAYTYKGDPVDLIWGKEGTAKSDGYGMSKIAKYHPEALGKIENWLKTLPEKSRTKNRIQLEDESVHVAIRLDWEGEKKHWILTAFKRKK